jgi:thiosulfate dehydrogenase [quinone] large subunit
MSKECCSEHPQESPAESCHGKSCCANTLALTYGSWLLRVWLAVRAIQTGVEKYAAVVQLPSEPVKVDGVPNAEGLSAVGSAKVYALENYHGVPAGLFKKFASEPLMKLPGPFEMWAKEFYKWCGGTIDGVKLSESPEAWQKFSNEPAFLHLFDYMLGPALIILGITILLGFAYRTSLFLLGLLYVSLTWGLILIKQDDGVSWLGVHMILIVMALALAQHNRLAILKKW